MGAGVDLTGLDVLPGGQYFSVVSRGKSPVFRDNAQVMSGAKFKIQSTKVN
jgi:hypothetical protein